MTKKIRTFIVDDERAAREDLRRELGKFDNLEIVGEAGSINEAALLISQHSLDVIFLDIQMPGENGFRLLELIEIHCAVIFVTAFDNYAIRAFEVNALDYLLKPVHPQRLTKTIARLSQQNKIQPQSSQLRLSYHELVIIRVEGRIRSLKVSNIIFIKANGDYTELQIASSERFSAKQLVLKSLREWEAQLPESHFIRINRATIVNKDSIERLEWQTNGLLKLYLRDYPEPLLTSHRQTALVKSRFL